MADNLPLHADRDQTKAIAAVASHYLDEALRHAMATAPGLDPSIVLAELCLATRRWLAERDAFRVRSVLSALSSADLRQGLAEHAAELEARGTHSVTYAVGQKPEATAREEFESAFALGTGVGVKP